MEEEEQYKERSAGKGRGRSRKSTDGEDEKEEIWKRWEKKNGKRQLVWRLEEKLGSDTEESLMQCPSRTVQSDKRTGQTGIRHGKLEWSRLYKWNGAYMTHMYQKDSV